MAQAGFFGKLPSRGDFVSRRLSADFVGPWDSWLQQAVTASREQLGDSWLETYLTSPIWRFMLAPGVAGEAARLGVLIPSVDSVGRYFPFSIAADNSTPGEGDRPALRAADVLRGEAGSWFAAAEQLALEGLDSELDLELLDARIKALEPASGARLESVPVAIGSDASVVARNAWRFGSAHGAALPQVGPEVIAALLDAAVGQFSLWWTEGSLAMTPTFLVCGGLPLAEHFASMLDGRYAARGWQDRPSPIVVRPPSDSVSRAPGEDDTKPLSEMRDAAPQEPVPMGIPGVPVAAAVGASSAETSTDDDTAVMPGAQPGGVDDGTLIMRSAVVEDGAVARSVAEGDTARQPRPVDDADESTIDPRSAGADDKARQPVVREAGDDDTQQSQTDTPTPTDEN